MKFILTKSFLEETLKELEETNNSCIAIIPELNIVRLQNSTDATEGTLMTNYGTFTSSSADFPIIKIL